MKREADLKQFFNLVASLKKDIPVPLLRELCALGKGKDIDKGAGPIGKKLERIYLRMCRVQEELGLLDLKKAAPGVSAEDFIFSTIDFSRYREIESCYFETLFSCGPEDFDEVFFKKNFALGREEIKAIVKGSYIKTEGLYKIQKENPVVLSLMRTLEMSLENSPLFTICEVKRELADIPGFRLSAENLYPVLVTGLDGITFTHRDGMKTNLFVAEQGKLSGTFMPAGKPWTRVLINLSQTD